MPIALHLSLSGESEQLLRRMEALDVSHEDVIGRALWLLKQALDTYRIALLTSTWEEVTERDKVVDRIIVAVDPTVLRKDTTVGPSLRVRPQSGGD